MNEQEIKDLETIKELTSKDYDQAYLEQFRFSELALLDIIDNECKEKDKQRLAQLIEHLKEPYLLPLQEKIDSAIYELAFEDNYRGTTPQQAFVNGRKNSLNLNKLISNKADNQLLTNYLIINKGMKVSNELRNSLYTKGHDELVSVIDSINERKVVAEIWDSQINQERPKKTKTITKNIHLKM